MVRVELNFENIRLPVYPTLMVSLTGMTNPKSSTRQMQRSLSDGAAQPDLQNWELTASFWIFFRRGSSTKPCECFYREQKLGLCLRRYIVPALSVYLQGLCLKINFVLLVNLPLSYADLLNKLYLLLWRPMSHETAFRPFILHIMGRIARRELGRQ